MPQDQQDIDASIELLLFGDDLRARTDQETADWRQEWVMAMKNTQRMAMVAWERKCRIWKCLRDWAWENRAGRSWQQSIESHVAAYRRPARKFSTDPAMMMLAIEKMAELGWVLIVRHDAYAYASFSKSEGGELLIGKTLPLSVARAIVSALEK